MTPRCDSRRHNVFNAMPATRFDRSAVGCSRQGIVLFSENIACWLHPNILIQKKFNSKQEWTKRVNVVTKIRTHTADAAVK